MKSTNSTARLESSTYYLKRKKNVKTAKINLIVKRSWMCKEKQTNTQIQAMFTHASVCECASLSSANTCNKLKIKICPKALHGSYQLPVRRMIESTGRSKSTKASPDVI